MQRRHIQLICAGLSVAFLALVVVTSGWGSTMARYVIWPVPSSVRVHGVESNDWLGLNPEPEVRVAFSASPQDIEGIIRRKRLAPADANARDWVEQRFGPASQAPGPNTASTRILMRQSRRGAEFLRIDETGTNAHYLLWGI